MEGSTKRILLCDKDTGTYVHLVGVWHPNDATWDARFKAFPNVNELSRLFADCKRLQNDSRPELACGWIVNQCLSTLSQVLFCLYSKVTVSRFYESYTFFIFLPYLPCPCLLVPPRHPPDLTGYRFFCPDLRGHRILSSAVRSQATEKIKRYQDWLVVTGTWLLFFHSVGTGIIIPTD